MVELSEGVSPIFQNRSYPVNDVVPVLIAQLLELDIVVAGVEMNRSRVLSINLVRYWHSTGTRLYQYLVERFEKMGFNRMPPDIEAFSTQIKTDQQKWPALVRRLGGKAN